MSHCRPFSTGEPCYGLHNESFGVLLCFPGSGTCHGFVGRLFLALLEQGIEIFLDQGSLEKGDHVSTTLERRIKESTICIPILSKGFPESKRCLKVVSLMVKSGVKIYPLFYDVLPNVLRCRDGSDYAEHFKRHESQKGLSKELIIEYKNALENVSNLCGWCFNQFNGRDELLIREVLIDVKKRLHSKNPYKAYLDIPKCFGLNLPVEHLRGVINGLFLEKKKMVKVGLHGMCGIGKTTLAKIVSKELPFSQFQLFSFVPGVGERCQEANGLVKLQTQMLRDVMSEFRGEVGHVDEGKGRLEDCLRGKKALLLLDDIESSEQLEALAGNYKGFGEGSCVIITSRDQQILIVANVDLVYEVRRLSHKDAMELFSSHAFPNSCCPDDQELQTLSSDIVSACEGLPLALQTFGRLLVFEKDEKVWGEMVGKISCEPSLQKKLRVSYDSLDSSEKEMFQDIACFFTWRKKDIVMIFWEGLIQSPHASLGNLLQKSLVSLGPSNEFLMMHRCFQDLGTSISNEMHKEARKRTRIFDEDDAYHVLRRPTEKAKLVRYFMYEPKQRMTLRAEIFKSLHNLQLLRLTDVSIQGHFSGEFFMDLRWLSLRNYSSKRLPQGMNLQNLVILEVTHSQIIQLWDETTQKIPTTKPGNLKMLILRGCESLKNLPATLCYTVLQMLDLHNCHSLSSLPNTVKSWTSLVNLDMEGCSVSCLPEDFGELANLQKLNLSYCQHLSKLPDSFGNLKNLRHLDLSCCMELMKLPVSFEDLTDLSHLNLHGCSKLALQSYILENMIRLVYLNLSGCRQLEELPEMSKLTSLEELCLLEIEKLRELPANIGRLTKLKKMSIGSELLTSLPTSIGDLSSLISLDIGNCPNLHFIPDSLGHLKLEYFQI